MRQTHFALALLTAAILAGCGGSRTGDQTLKTKFSAQVSFGDSLSDVGTYAVGTVLALKGGKFTINGDNTAINPAFTGKNFTELMAAQFSLPAPCAAQTGLDGDAAQGFSVPVVNHAGCFGYAQGGARVTDPVGPGNKLTGSPLGALTVPVVTQVKNHLAAVGGKFKGDEIVFMLAGANDILFLTEKLTADATAAGAAAGATAGAATFGNILVGSLVAGVPAANQPGAAQAIGTALASGTAPNVAAAVGVAANLGYAALVSNPALVPSLVAAATSAAITAGNAAGTKAATDFATVSGPALVGAMTTAGTQLVTLVKTQIVANGANFVTVINIPDVATTPSALAQSASSQALIAAMVKAFNDQLVSGFAGESRVLLVDGFSVTHDQATNPGPYGLTNVTDTACDLTPAKNALGSSLACNASNLKAGDVSHYSFADGVHPTPFFTLLVARYVAEKMVIRGWL